MKFLDWSDTKNTRLKKERDISFEEIVVAIAEGFLIDVVRNPSSNFANQQVLIVKVADYIYYVPYIEDGDKIFLKTITPSRNNYKLLLI